MTNKYFALITGASSGIGEACAKLLAKTNKNLILLARRKERLEQLADHLRNEYAIEVLTYQVDVESVEQVNLFFDDIKTYPLDVLINNAGMALGKETMADGNWEDYDRMIAVNVRAFTRIAQRSIPQLKQQEGHMINISSIAGAEAYAGGAVYCGTKAFVKMMSKGLRLDLLGTGVRVTDIAPGATETEFSLVRFKGDRQKASGVYDGFIPLDAKDVAEAILFCLSRPKNVNVEYMLITPTAQASATAIYRTQTS